METVFITALLGAIMSILTELAKKAGIKTSDALLILTLLAGAGYAAFVQFFPEGLQENVISFVQQAVGSAVILYAALKKIRPNS